MRRSKLLAVALMSYIAPASAQITGRGEYGLDAILNVLAAITNLIYIGPAGRLGPNESIAFLLVLGFLYFILNQFVYLTWVFVRENVDDSRGVGIDDDFDDRYTPALSVVLAVLAVQVLWPVGFGVAILIGIIALSVFLLRFSGIIGGTAGSSSLGAKAIDRADQKLHERERDTQDVEETEQEVDEREDQVEDLEEEAEEDLEKGDEEEAEKKAEIAYEELHNVAMLLIREERTISHLAELESEELENAIEIGRKVSGRNQQVEDILDELDEELGTVIYESLARTFQGDRSDRVFNRMIEEYLENPEELREDIEDGVFAVASDQDPGNAEQLLQQVENTLEEDLEIEEINFAEIKSIIQNNRQVLEDFKQLKEEIETAVSEEKELEKIMEELGKREEIEDLHQQIEHIKEGFLEAKKKQETLSQVESQLEGMEGAGDEFDRIQQLIERKQKREAVLQILKKKLDSQERTGQEGAPDFSDIAWENVLEENGYDLDSSSTWAYGSYKGYLPYQGFKLHISSGDQEAEELIRVLAPILSGNHPDISMQVEHKCYKSVRARNRNSKRQQPKLFTIYPDAPKNQYTPERGLGVFVQGDPDFNRSVMFANARNFQTVLGEVIDAIKKSGVSLQGGPDIPGEPRYRNTRVHFRYAAMASYHARIKRNDKEIEVIPAWNDPSSDRFDHDRFKDVCNRIGFSGRNPQLSGDELRQKVFEPKATPIFGINGDIEGDSYHPPKEALERQMDFS